MTGPSRLESDPADANEPGGLLKGLATGNHQSVSMNFLVTWTKLPANRLLENFALALHCFLCMVGCSSHHSPKSMGCAPQALYVAHPPFSNVAPLGVFGLGTMSTVTSKMPVPRGRKFKSSGRGASAPCWASGFS